MAIFSALIVGLICAVLWMGSIRKSMCFRDPPKKKYGGVRYVWDLSHGLGSVVNYQCTPHQMSPIVATLQCTYRRRWELASVNNESCNCDRLPPIIPRTYQNVSATKIGSRISYHCDANFRTPAIHLVECSVFKEWVLLDTKNTSCIQQHIIAVANITDFT